MCLTISKSNPLKPYNNSRIRYKYLERVDAYHRWSASTLGKSYKHGKAPYRNTHYTVGKTYLAKGDPAFPQLFGFHVLLEEPKRGELIAKVQVSGFSRRGHFLDLKCETWKKMKILSITGRGL